MIGIVVGIVITALFASFFVMRDSPKSTDVYWYDEKTGLAQCRKSVYIRAAHDGLTAEENRLKKKNVETQKEINDLIEAYRKEDIPREVKVVDSRYHSAVENDLESYRKIMSDINPEFDAEFDIVEKPKNAQYFRNKREKYIEKYIEENTPRWQREGREMCDAIILEIDKKVEDDPESKALCLLDQQFDWTDKEVIKPHPYNLLDEESRKECDKCLTGLGFKVGEYSYHTRVGW